MAALTADSSNILDLIKESYNVSVSVAPASVMCSHCRVYHNVFHCQCLPLVELTSLFIPCVMSKLLVICKLLSIHVLVLCQGLKVMHVSMYIVEEL